MLIPTRNADLISANKSISERFFVAEKPFAVRLR